MDSTGDSSKEILASISQSLTELANWNEEPTEDDNASGLTDVNKRLIQLWSDYFLTRQDQDVDSELIKLVEVTWKVQIPKFWDLLSKQRPGSERFMRDFVSFAKERLDCMLDSFRPLKGQFTVYLGDMYRWSAEIGPEAEKQKQQAKQWYTKAIDLNPKSGDLYHRMVLVTQPSLEQLSRFGLCFTSVGPFDGARKLFPRIFREFQQTSDEKAPFLSQFIALHENWFNRNLTKEAESVRNDVARSIDDFIGTSKESFGALGVYISILNIAALSEYGITRLDGSSTSLVRSKLKQQSDNSGISPQFTQLTPEEINSSNRFVASASILTFEIFGFALGRPDDANVWPMLHLYFVLLWNLCSRNTGIMELCKKEIPWTRTADFLNRLVLTSSKNQGAFHEGPTPEEFDMNGQWWSEGWFKDGWFEIGILSNAESCLVRIPRIMSLGRYIAALDKGLTYNVKLGKYDVPLHYQLLQMDLSPMQTLLG